MKKEIHLRLIKRIFTACLLAAICAVAGAAYLEYSRLDRTIPAIALKESTIFSSFFTDYHDNPGEENLAALKRMVGANMERTSFILVEFLSSDKELLFVKAQEAGTAIAEKFDGKGFLLSPSVQPDSIRIFTNKRIYLQTMFPIQDLGNGSVIGYLRGIYQVSLEDTKVLMGRLALTTGTAAASVFLCGFMIYLGILFLNNHLIRSAGELSRANTFLLRMLGSALAKCDTLETGHNHRVVIYATSLAEQSNLPRDQIRSLIHGAFLHDIEMLPINHTILHKAAALDTGELALIKRHSGNGAALIKKFRWLRDAAPIVHYHHEKYDGSGYPAGLIHEKIPLTARILAIADAFDALSSKRPYRDALPLQESLRKIEQESGTHFDPILVSSFVQIAPQLYSKISSFNEKQLDKELDKVLKKYLKL